MGDSMTNSEIWRWARGEADAVTLENPIHRHFEWLPNEAEPEVQWEHLGQKFHALVDALGERISSLRAILVVPLAESEGMLPLVDNPGGLFATRGDEPPSLYLLARESAMQLEICEEYRLPVEIQALTRGDPAIYVYYRAHRSAQVGLHEDGPWTKAIYAEYYPESMRVLMLK